MILNKNEILSILLVSNFLNAGLSDKVLIPEELKKELIPLDIKTFYNEGRLSAKPNIKQTTRNTLIYLAAVDYFNEEEYYICNSNEEVDAFVRLVTDPNGPAHMISWYTCDVTKYNLIKKDDHLEIASVAKHVSSLKEPASKKNATI